MPENLDSLVEKFKDAENQLDLLLSGPDPISDARLRDLDKSISQAFDNLLEAEFDNVDDYLRRAKVLLQQIRTTNIAGTITERLTLQIESDLVRYQQSQMQPNLRLVSEGAELYTLPQQFIELCYSSTAVSRMQDTALQALKSQSQKSNLEHAITGLLAYDHKTRRFFQVLEGPENNVRRLMNRIINDKRHEDIKILFVTRISSRVFGQWSMELLTADQIKNELKLGETIPDWLERSAGIRNEEVKTPGHRWMIESLQNSVH